MPPAVVELSPEEVARLAKAIAALVPANLAQFAALLELGYLAASADGLDRAERDVLAAILAGASGAAIDQPTFEAHFSDLDAAVTALGRRERLARTAADFDTDAARADAIRFAALVAMADGALHEPELLVLTEVGGHFAWTADRVRALVDDAASRVKDVR